MDTLLFYVKNGEKLELSIIIRSRTHSSLTPSQVRYQLRYTRIRG